MVLAMADLALEVIVHIASFLEREDDQSHVPLLFRKQHPSKLPPYATISRQWQYAIERRTFRDLRLKSTELQYFSDTVVGHRRAALTYLRYEVVLPTYGDDECARFERKKDRKLNDEAFTEAIHGLFRVLKSWEVDDETGTRESGAHIQTGSFALDLCEVYSPMDGIHRGTEKYRQDMFQSELGKRKDLFHHRYEHSVISLLKPQDLPSVSRIWHFRASVYSHRVVKPHSIAAMAAKLGHLKSIEWSLNDNEKKYPKLRLENRSGFAQCISSLAQLPLQTFRLEYYHEAPVNHAFSPPSVLDSSLIPPPADHLSFALRTLTQAPSLININLSGPIVISPELYWPVEGSVAPPPLWPNVQTFHVQFDITTPDGDWYFTRDPDTKHDENHDEYEHDYDEGDSDSSSEEDEDEEGAEPSLPLTSDSFDAHREARRAGDRPTRIFRFYPDSGKVIPLLTAMARAAGRMPNLRRMSLVGSIVGNEGATFEVMYVAPGLRGELDSEPGDEGRPRLYWQVGRWRPDGEVEKLWREAMEVGGKELVVRFLER